MGNAEGSTKIATRAGRTMNRWRVSYVGECTKKTPGFEQREPGRRQRLLPAKAFSSVRRQYRIAGCVRRDGERGHVVTKGLAGFDVEPVVDSGVHA